MTSGEFLEDIPAPEAQQTFSQITEQDEQQTLRQCLEKTLQNYFREIEGQHVTDLYQMVLHEVEAPLMEAVMKYTRNNQTHASQMLGLNRGTLRKKLKQYGLL